MARLCQPYTLLVLCALWATTLAGESLGNLDARAHLRATTFTLSVNRTDGCQERHSPLTLAEATRAAEQVYPRHAAVIIDPARYYSNLRRLVDTLGSSEEGVSIPLECMFVMKANAYGHGISRLVPAVSASGATYIGVVDTWEALAARRAGWKGGLFRLRGAATSEVAVLHKSPDLVNMDEWVGDAAEAKELNRLAGHRNQTLMTHFSFCKFMNRNAFQTVDEAVRAATKSPNLCVRGLLVHMPTADTDPVGTRARITEFFSMVIEALPRMLKIRDEHASEECRREKIIISWANSATVVRYGNADPLYVDFVRNITEAGWRDHIRLMARPGHITYGQASGVSYTDTDALPAFGFLDGTPAPGLQPPGGFDGQHWRHVPSLQSLMTYVAWSPSLRRFKGFNPVTVGYGVSRVRAFVGEKQIHTSLATLPIGWADAVSREGESNFGDIDIVYDETMSRAQVYKRKEDCTDSTLLDWPGAAIMVGPWGGGMSYIAGRVSMDMTSLDVSGLVQSRKMAGTNPAFFVLLGRAGGSEITTAYANARRNADSAEPTIQISRMTEANPDIVRIWGPLPCSAAPSAPEFQDGPRINSDDDSQVDEDLLWRFFQALLSTPIGQDAAHPTGEAGIAWEGVHEALKAMGIDNHYLRPLPDPDTYDDDDDDDDDTKSASATLV